MSEPSYVEELDEIEELLRRLRDEYTPYPSEADTPR